MAKKIHFRVLAFYIWEEIFLQGVCLSFLFLLAFLLLVLIYPGASENQRAIPMPRSHKSSICSNKCHNFLETKQSSIHQDEPLSLNRRKVVPSPATISRNQLTNTKGCLFLLLESKRSCHPQNVYFSLQRASDF